MPSTRYLCKKDNVRNPIIEGICHEETTFSKDKK
jgi:hypothetical protein